MFPSVPYDPYTTNFDAIETVGDALLGGLYYDQGELFMFVYNASADTDGIAGQMCCWDNGGTIGHVSMKAAEVVAETLVGAKAVGMFVYAIEFGNYGFVKVVGYTTDKTRAAIHVTDGSVAQGDHLVIAGTTTPTFIGHTAIAGEEHLVYGQALADDTGDPVVLASLNCLP